EQRATLVDEAIEGALVVGPEPAPQREVVGAIDDVDRVELQSPGVSDELLNAGRGERMPPGAAKVLALEEERGDGAQREGRPGRHARGLARPARRRHHSGARRHCCCCCSAASSITTMPRSRRRSGISGYTGTSMCSISS